MSNSMDRFSNLNLPKSQDDAAKLGRNIALKKEDLIQLSRETLAFFDIRLEDLEDSKKEDELAA